MHQEKYKNSSRLFFLTFTFALNTSVNQLSHIFDLFSIEPVTALSNEARTKTFQAADSHC